MVQGGMSVVKFLLFAFNFIFVACGIALITVGAIAKTSGTDYTIFLDSKLITAPVILIIIGCIIFLIAFLGCWGAMRQNYCMVMTFGILLLIIFVVEIACGIAAYVYRSDLDNFLKKNMEDILRQNKTDGIKVFNNLQNEFDCCGVNGVKDYVTNNLPIPDTCCGKVVRKEPCTEAEVGNKGGCYQKFEDKIKSKLVQVGGAGIGIAFVEILGMIFAWCLASAIKKEYEGV